MFCFAPKSGKGRKMSSSAAILLSSYACLIPQSAVDEANTSMHKALPLQRSGLCIIGLRGESERSHKEQRERFFWSCQQRRQSPCERQSGALLYSISQMESGEKGKISTNITPGKLTVLCSLKLNGAHISH